MKLLLNELIIIKSILIFIDFPNFSMEIDTHIENKATEALRLISLDDSSNNWCNKLNLPKIRKEHHTSKNNHTKINTC